MIGHWWLYGRKWSSSPLPNRKLGSPNTEAPQEIWNLPSPRKTRKKNSLPQKKIFVGRGDYVPWKIRIQIQTTVKLRNCRNYNQDNFFPWDLYSIFLYRELSSPSWENHPHLKCQFPSKIRIWPKSILYKHSEKWLSPLPPSLRGDEYDLGLTPWGKQLQEKWKKGWKGYRKAD